MPSLVASSEPQVPLAQFATVNHIVSVDDRKRQGVADTKQVERAWSRSRALSGLRKGARPDSHDQGRSSQFDPAIDKERKLISNLR
jgi:hypothetical protein